MNQIEELIYFFTHNKNLTKEQREKRDKLLARDVVKPKTPVATYQIDKSKGHRPGLKLSYISPKGLKQFLLDFNQDEILKYTCHLIDTQETINQIREETNSPEYNFDKHRLLIADRYKALKERHKWPKYKMVSLMNAYLLGDLNGMFRRWSSNCIIDNWNYINIRSWAKDNPGIIPNPGKNIARKQKNNGYTLPKAFIAKHSGNRVYRFGDLVLFFKSLFHIRRDNSLRSIIEHVTKNRQDIELNFSEDNFFDNIELLTDVDKLIQAFLRIVKICAENHSNSEVKLMLDVSFYNKEGYTFFVIHHKNSVYGKSLKNVMERIGEEQSNLIESQINGLCDLFIEADFGQGEYARVNLWDEATEMRDTRIEKMNGVKYLLRF